MKALDYLLSITSIVFTLFFFSVEAKGQVTLDALIQKGIDAFTKKEFTRSLAYFQQAVKRKPDDANLLYATGVLYSMTSQHQKSMEVLQKVTRWGLGYRVEEETNLDGLKASSFYPMLKKDIDQSKRPVHTSTASFSIPGKDLIPESIAYDPNQDCFYVGSLHKSKIIKYGRDKIPMDFTTSSQDGLWSVVGIKVDASRRVLWANSAAEKYMIGFQEKDFGRTGLFKFELSSGKLLKKYVPAFNQTERHLFNDLVISRKGDVFVTDHLGSSVMCVPNGPKNKLTIWLHSDELFRPNGIAFNADQTKLFVAHSNGIALIDVATRKLVQIKHPDTITLSQVDGLYFYQNSLIAVQTSLKRVNQYFLDTTLTKVVNYRILEANHPAFQEPTTGVLVDDTFHFIANSQIDSFDQAGNLFPPEKLHDVLVLSIKLNTQK